MSRKREIPEIWVKKGLVGTLSWYIFKPQLYTILSSHTSRISGSESLFSSQKFLNQFAIFCLFDMLIPI